MLGGGTTLDGPSQTLPALYAISADDYNDITSGSNGVFSAGPGYDEVTGMGTPKASLVVADLATFGTATQIGVTAQPPGNVIAGASFGVVVAAENSQGSIDPAFNGTLTIALASNPGGATLGGTLTVQAYHGVAVFDGLTLDQTGSGYTLPDHQLDVPGDHDPGVQRDRQPDALAGHVLPGPDRRQLAGRHQSGRQQLVLLEHDPPVGLDVHADQLVPRVSS